MCAGGVEGDVCAGVLRGCVRWGVEGMCALRVLRGMCAYLWVCTWGNEGDVYIPIGVRWGC